MSWKVKFFQTTRGKLPVKEFIEEQNMVEQTKIAHAIKLLTDSGPFLKPPYAKKVKDKLYELRISGSVEIRIFYTIYNDEYYLLHLFKKKSQKTPSREINTALGRIRELQ